jgi:hypothetical protein
MRKAWANAASLASEKSVGWMIDSIGCGFIGGPSIASGDSFHHGPRRAVQP